MTTEIKSPSPDRRSISALPSWWAPKRKLGYRHTPDIISGIAVLLGGIGCSTVAAQLGGAIIALTGLWLVGCGYNLFQVGRDLGEARSTWAYATTVLPLLLVWWAVLPFVLLRNGIRLVAGRTATTIADSAFLNAKPVVAVNRLLTAAIKSAWGLGAIVLKTTGLSLLAVLKTGLVIVLVAVALGITVWVIRSGMNVLAGAPALAVVIILLLLLR